MKKQIRRVLIDFLLVICGGFLTCEFFIIFTRGVFYFVAEPFGLLVLEILAVISVLIFATIHTLKEEIEENKISWAGVGLVGVGLALMVNIILAWNYGGFYPGIEPNVISCLTELTLYVALTLLGIGSLLIDLRNLRRSE